MDHLLSNYERELGLLRRSMAIFAARHPTMAARLGIVGGHSEDMHVERLLQSFALLAANLDSRLDDPYPEFTDALLGMVYPQYARPFPACTIAQFDVASRFDKLSEPATIPRGTEIKSKTTGYRFRTIHDVTLAPVRISNARYTPVTTMVPSGVALPAGTTGILSITFAITRPNFRIEDIPGPLRMHVDGPGEIVSTTIDAMMLNTVGSFVENATGRWTPLNASPLAAVGCDDMEKLIDEDESQTALRLLTEYFSFPKKFDFVDIDFKALARVAGPGQHLTLHLAIRRVHPDSWPAQRMKRLSAENIRLFCTPIVNLFRLESLHLKRDLVTGAYPVITPKTAAAGSEIWSVNGVHAMAGTAKTMSIHPFTSLMHGSSSKLTGPYWILMQSGTGDGAEKTDTAIGLVGLDGLHHEDSQIEQIAATITCTNGNHTRTMRFGAKDGDLESEQGVVTRIAMLGVPTELKRPLRDGADPWRLVAQLAPHSIELTRAGLGELKRVFRQFTAQSPVLAGLIDGLVNLSHRSKMLWSEKPMPSLVRGLEVTLVVDESVFLAASLSAFIGVMECFFAQHVSVISFVQLVVLSANTGVEIQRCAPRPGTAPLV